MRRPARGDDLQSVVLRKSFIYGHFLKSKLREVAAICMNKYRTCVNCGTELTQPCSPLVPLRSWEVVA
jgi:hypothetical protein